MEQNKNSKILLEVHVRFQLLNYQFKLALRRTWLLALILAAVKLFIIVWARHGP